MLRVREHAYTSALCMLDVSFVTVQQIRRKAMENWVNVKYLVNSIIEEKLHTGRERIVLERSSFGWLRPLVRSLVSLIF